MTTEEADRMLAAREIGALFGDAGSRQSSLAYLNGYGLFCPKCGEMLMIGKWSPDRTFLKRRKGMPATVYEVHCKCCSVLTEWMPSHRDAIDLASEIVDKLKEQK